ncbi:MAG TPA: TetR/AcrR family transcriptional regulator [Pseudonocardia sp.]|nr:TetR/AcrR family transcriptional regulator [Pseudonocardia sp.]
MSGTRDARQRVMHATVELLYEGGLRAAAPAAIAERAGAGKMSLYRHFDGKDDLVAAALRDYVPTQLERLLGPGNGDPRQRILAIFDRLADYTEKGTLNTCVYVTTRLELSDADHPAAFVATEYKREFAAALAALLREMGHPEPDSTGRVISMLIDGATVHSLTAGDPGPIRDARNMVETLLGPAET